MLIPIYKERGGYTDESYNEGSGADDWTQAKGDSGVQ